MLHLIMLYIYVNITYQYDNDIYYTIQYDMHQYVMISIIRYEKHAPIYLYQMYNAIYKTKEIK